MIKAQIVADSLSPQGDRLVSVLATFPRIILTEVNTHRMLSKNTSSSRAIPFKKMVEAIQENPFIPIAWQKEHKGMQGNEYLIHTEANKEDWLKARDYVIEYAENLNNGGEGVTKQLCNRLLEPFMWTTMLITGSKEGWDNFFNLRCPQYTTPVAGDGYYAKSWKELCSWHSNPANEELLEKADLLFKLKHNKGQAEIHIMDLAEKIYDVMNESTPEKLNSNEWHIPFKGQMEVPVLIDLAQKNLTRYNRELSVDVHDIQKEVDTLIVKISTAMAARTSYTVVGDEKEVDYERMIGLHDRLIAQNPPHSSPMEHCARAMSGEEYETHYKGILSKGLEYYHPQEEDMGWCRNFKGFIQYRHIIETT